MKLFRPFSLPGRSESESQLSGIKLCGSFEGVSLSITVLHCSRQARKHVRLLNYRLIHVAYLSKHHFVADENEQDWYRPLGLAPCSVPARLLLKSCVILCVSGSARTKQGVVLGTQGRSLDLQSIGGEVGEAP